MLRIFTKKKKKRNHAKIIFNVALDETFEFTYDIFMCTIMSFSLAVWSDRVMDLWLINCVDMEDEHKINSKQINICQSPPHILITSDDKVGFFFFFIRVKWDIWHLDRGIYRKSWSIISLFFFLSFFFSSKKKNHLRWLLINLRGDIKYKYLL
jgi:hypothetical protein